jgi:hypothetical protein
VLLAFAAVGAPLLARNVVRYGTPFYNVNNWLLFADEYRDPVELAAERTLAEAARDYLRTHSTGELAARELRGLVWEAFILIRSFGPAPLDDARVLPGLAVLVFGIVGMAATRRDDALLVAIWTALLIFMFAWYVPIAAGERFVLPVLVPWLAFAAEGAARVLQVVRAGRSPDRTGRLLAGGCIGWCLAWIAAEVVAGI